MNSKERGKKKTNISYANSVIPVAGLIHLICAIWEQQKRQTNFESNYMNYVANELGCFDQNDLGFIEFQANFWIFFASIKETNISSYWKMAYGIKNDNFTVLFSQDFLHLRI